MIRIICSIFLAAIALQQISDAALLEKQTKIKPPWIPIPIVPSTSASAATTTTSTTTSTGSTQASCTLVMGCIECNTAPTDGKCDRNPISLPAPCYMDDFCSLNPTGPYCHRGCTYTPPA